MQFTIVYFSFCVGGLYKCVWLWGVLCVHVCTANLLIHTFLCLYNVNVCYVLIVRLKLNDIEVNLSSKINILHLAIPRLINDGNNNHIDRNMNVTGLYVYFFI